MLGNICGDIFYVIFIIKKCRYLSVDFRKLKVTGAEVLAVLAIGIPASVTNFMQSIGVTLTNRFYSRMEQIKSQRWELPSKSS